MNYKTYIPALTLSKYIKCYWTLEASKENDPQKQRIVPDGCIEMIFHYGDFYKQYLENGKCIVQPKCFVFGQITQPLEIEPTGETGIFAIRFFPDAFTSFSTKPISEMENRAVPLRELYGKEGFQLETEILNALTVENRITMIENFFFKKLNTLNNIDNITKSCIDIIFQLNGQVTVDKLSAQLNINRRQIERRFSSVIGVSPKQLSKIIRLQATLKMLLNNQYTSLTSVAYAGDYYDQAHFIKDFKEFTGVSPKDFYSENLKMTALFSGKD